MLVHPRLGAEKAGVLAPGAWEGGFSHLQHGTTRACLVIVPSYRAGKGTWGDSADSLCQLGVTWSALLLGSPDMLKQRQGTRCLLVNMWCSKGPQRKNNESRDGNWTSAGPGVCAGAHDCVAQCIWLCMKSVTTQTLQEMLALPGPHYRWAAAVNQLCCWIW